MRINILSNAPWSFTGYANQTALFAPRINKHHPTSITAFWGHDGSPINWNGVQVFGKSFHPYGQDIMHGHAETWKADIMISIMDAWVCEPQGMLGTRWVPWFPIDSEPLPKRVYEAVKQAYARIVFSHFGEKMMDQAGLDYYYVPHGVDTKVMKPLDMAESRAALKLPLDKFIVGMVAANKGNPPRKAFHQNIAAFAALQKKYKDCVLYLHTIDGSRGGYEVVELIPYIQALGLTYGYMFDKSAETADVIFADQYGLALGYPAEQMAQIYSSMDVHMLVSMGEGFGIPILEAQACGTPVLVGDWTSMSELCFSGWKVAKKDAEPIFHNLHAFQYLPRAAAIAEKLEMAYRMRGNQDYRKRARAGALKYDADLVMEKYWLPTLEKIEKRIAEDKARGGCSHQWGQIGQFDKYDGCLHVPCLKCNDALRKAKDGSLSVVKDYYKFDELDFLPDTDGITKIVSKEIKQDYEIDNLEIKPGDVILDIGAHKGIVSCYLAKKYPQATIYAFEPAEENFKALTENLKRNKIENVKPRLCAVTGDGRDVRIAFDAVQNSGGSNIYGGAGKTVPSIMLSDIMGRQFGLEGKRIALLKIDCEGAEFEILQSANGLLKNISALRGEFHRGHGDADALLAKVRAEIPDVVITMQG